MIETSLEPFLANARLQVRGGPPTIIPARLVSGLSMALYELATNATKYGPLGANEKGVVVLTWRKDSDRCKMEWRETGGAAPKNEEAFGATLIRSAMNAEKDARVSYTMGADGLACVYEWAAQAAAPDDVAAERERARV